MSKLSFKTFCIEFYAEYKGISSEKVYEIFKTSGVLNMLDEDYDDLHSFGFEYMVNYVDEYLGAVQV